MRCRYCGGNPCECPSADIETRLRATANVLCIEAADTIAALRARVPARTEGDAEIERAWKVIRSFVKFPVDDFRDNAHFLEVKAAAARLDARLSVLPAGADDV